MLGKLLNNITDRNLHISTNPNSLRKPSITKGGAVMMAFKERMYLRSFQEISKILSSTLSVDEVLDHIVRQITEVMNLKGATIRLVNPKTNRLELAAAHGLSEKYLNKGTVDLDKS